MVPASDPERSAMGKRISTLRRQRGLTQRELAEAVGVTVRSVQSWEQGHSHPYRHLRTLEEVLGRPLAPRTEITVIDEVLDTDELSDRVQVLNRGGRDQRMADLEARLRDVEHRLAEVEKRTTPRKKTPQN